MPSQVFTGSPIVRRAPYMPFFPKDFLADTAQVSGEAAGFYSILLMHAWSQGGSLPTDEAALRLLLRISRQRWNAVRGEIMPFWKLGDDGRLHQKRLDREWLKACRIGDGNGANLPECSSNIALHTMPKKRDFTTRARAGASGQEVRKKEEARGTRATPPGKNRGRKGRRNETDRTPHGLDFANADIERLQAKEREQLGIEGSSSDPPAMGAISAIRH